MLFIDDDNVLAHYKLYQQEKELTQRKALLEKNIAATKLEIEQFKNNFKQIEKLGREKFLMKKDNETLFIINEIY